MSHPKADFTDALKSNVAALATFWNRRPFHDMSIESVSRLNKRIVLTLDEYYLVLIGATRFKVEVDEFPTSWISETLSVGNGHAVLRVEAELGEFEAEFQNLRLLRRNDFAILIPPFDG